MQLGNLCTIEEVVKFFATHIVKVKGEWKGGLEELRQYVRRKVREIDSFFSPETELIKLDGVTAEVWVLISTLIETSELQEMAEKWAKNHLDVRITEITVEELKAFTDLKQGKLPTHVILLSGRLKNLNTTGAE